MLKYEKYGVMILKHAQLEHWEELQHLPCIWMDNHGQIDRDIYKYINIKRENYSKSNCTNTSFMILIARNELEFK